jgi:chitin disaccharide deacetylase
MARPESPRRLIVNADDFGRSHSINQAVIQAHTGGILTTASLMVGESACDEAVELARKHSRLGVGLHLTLSCGRAVLPPEKIPGLADANGAFETDPAAAGWRYFFRRELREPLRQEIHAQFDRFHAARLPLDHVNGHQHMHLHPIVFRILMEDAGKLGIRHLRLTRDPFWLNAGLAPGRWRYRASHGFIYSWLSWRARAPLERRGIRHTKRVFGLLQNGRVHESYVLRLLARLPPGDSELYSHPSLDEFKDEFDALLSARVKAAVSRTGAQLIRYQDL